MTKINNYERDGHEMEYLKQNDFFYLSTNNLVTIIPAITQKISPTPLMIHSLYCKKKLQKKKDKRCHSDATHVV